MNKRIAFGTIALSLLAVAQMAHGAGQTELISEGLAGAAAGNSFIEGPHAVSADGRYVVFSSTASNVVSGDTNNAKDVFVRDRQSGTVERVSVSSSGAEGNSGSGQCAISADGRYVVFASEAANLVSDDTNPWQDVFVRDRQSGTTERVSVGSSGQQANNKSGLPAISADGRYVSFASEATNLVDADTNEEVVDVFVHDRVGGTTSLVSKSSTSIQGGESTTSDISADGRFVTFVSIAALVPGDTNHNFDIFVRDRVSHTTSRVNDRNGQDPKGGSDDPTITADGHYVGFVSCASDLVLGDTNDSCESFVYDRVSGTTERVSVDSSGGQANSSSGAPSISPDGRFVAFGSCASNLVAGDVNGQCDIFMRDRVSGTTERVSLDSGGGEGNGGSFDAATSADGRFVAFWSNASNLAGTDSNQLADVYLRDRGAATAKFSLSPTSLAFGKQLRNTSSAARVIKVTNTGSAAVTISSVQVSGADAAQFSRTTKCGTLAAGATCQIKVVFSPIGTGARSATITVNAASGGFKTVVLSGTGVIASFTLTPATVRFADQSRNTSSAPKVIKLTNTTPGALQIASFTFGGNNPGQFAQTTDCGSSVPEGGSCSIRVLFRPTTAGNKAATLTVQAPGGQPNRVVSLSGLGL